MKNKVILCFFVSLIFLLSGCEEYKYEPGRDTSAYWGKDAQYQILHVGRESLVNLDDNTEIEPMVHKYFRNGDYVYFHGSRGYTTLNYKTGEVKQNINLESFNSEENTIFKSKIFRLESCDSEEKIMFGKNVFGIVTEQEYCEFKSKYTYWNVRTYLGYSPSDEITKNFLLKNQNKIINKTIIEWFDNNYESFNIDNFEENEKELLSYLNKKIPKIKIVKLTLFIE